MAEKLEKNDFSETEELNNGGAETNVDGDGAEIKQTPEIDSKYRLILLAAQRSKQLQKGAQPRVQADPRRMKPTRIALEEIKQKKIHFEITDEK
jgi:DNA-directed RNA polymerase omega subunit